MPAEAKSLASLYWSLIVTIALAGAIVVALFWLTARAEDDDAWVRHSLEVHDLLTEVLSLVQRAESGQRGYLLTGRDSYLVPYDASIAQIPAALDHVAALVGDNPRQMQALGNLRGRIDEKSRELKSTVDAEKAGNRAAATAIVVSDDGRRSMDAIRDAVATMQTEEIRLLTERKATAERTDAWLQVSVATAFLLICAVGSLVAYYARRSFGELRAAHDRLVSSNEQLVEQISQRAEVEGQLRQAQKMEAIGQLTGGIAHDFNNMLGVIVGSLELMQRRIRKGDFNIDRFVATASTATARASALTQRLLAFARRQPLAPQVLDANRMIATMSDLLRSTLGEQIRIETVSAAGLWLTHADPHQLENAILNIAINARDAMPSGGKLTIETANTYLDEAYCAQNTEVQPGQYVQIAISDTGTGMPPDVAAQVFDPFFTTKPAGQGTGLGLSQVYGFIKQSRGHVKIYSELGSGTTVKIYLPRLIGEAGSSRREQVPQAQMGNASEVVLVVEDDALMRQMSADALRDLGYGVLDSDSAKGALALLDEKPEIRLLFTDVVMPDVNGKKLADEALRRRPELKVLFTTGYTRNAVVHGGVLDAGVNFLSKPFTLEQLAAKVRSVLDA